MTSKCHRDCPKLAKIIAAENIVEPMSEIDLGEKRFAQATTNGAPMVMREMDIVPIRSINAGDAPVKGVFGCCESVSKTAWKMPKAKLIPQQVTTIVNEAMVMMMVCLMKELGTAFHSKGRDCRNRSADDADYGAHELKKHTDSKIGCQEHV